MCCAETGYTEKDANGKCPDCGEPTVDGEAVEACSYSEKYCETCGWAPCSGAC